MSLPALLPSFSVVWVTSRMSSMTWKARPRLWPKSVRRGELLRRGVGRHGAEADRAGDERGGLVLVDVAQFGRGDLLAFALEVGDLSGDELLAAGGDGEFVDERRRASSAARPWHEAAISNAMVSSASPASTAMPSP